MFFWLNQNQKKKIMMKSPRSANMYVTGIQNLNPKELQNEECTENRID